MFPYRAVAMTTALPGLRERKKQRTYEDLQRAALELFARRGFDQVTIEDICAAAEVSKTTFYRYFDAKEDVLFGPAAERAALMGEVLRNRPVDEPAIAAVQNAFREFAELYQIDRDQKRAVHEIVRATPTLAARNLEHIATWEEMLRECFASRDPAPGSGRDRELRNYVAAATVVAALRAAVEYWLTHDAAQDLPAIVEDALQASVAISRRTHGR
jgi:AcrR family transcriptional regulator